MARPISWLGRLHEIHRRVAGSVRSHYERREIENLFELQPRAAQMLLEMLPGVMVGRARLVEREALLEFLERIRFADDVGAEMKRSRRERAEVSRRKVRTLVRRDLVPGSLNSLPAGVELSRCRLEISFRTIEDLAESMYAVARAIEADGDEMARLYEVSSGSPDDNCGEDAEYLFAALGL